MVMMISEANKFSITNISDDLPKYLDGYIIAPAFFDDSGKRVFLLASKIVSLLQFDTAKKLVVKDPETVEKLIDEYLEYLKPIVLHVAFELKSLEYDYLVLAIVSKKCIRGVAVVYRNDLDGLDIDTSSTRGVVIIVTDTKLSLKDREEILRKLQDIVDRYSLRLSLWSPPITATEDVRILRISSCGTEFIKVRIREDYGKPITINIPVERPSWNIDDLPPKLREEIKLLVVEPLRSGANYAPRGMIIVGPPGVGKSVAAEALAHALGKKVVRLAPSTYRSMWYGMTEKMLSKIFRAVKKRKDVVLVVDDADFLVQRLYALHEAYIAEVNVWLNMLQDRTKPFTVLTTNVPDIIDPALIRPGRLDIALVMGYPDREMRKQIALRAAKRYGVKVSEEVLEEIVRMTRWFNAAEIDALVRIAASKGKGTITLETIEWARRKFYVSDAERKHIQETLQTYGRKLQGLVITYVPKESEI